MTSARTLLAAAALTLAIPASAAALGSLPAAAAADGACPTLDDGVTVVVDFQHLGGGAVTRCAPGDPESGLAALAGAGFRVDQVANQPGFVCRIDGLPGTDTEDCADTPPASAYWGYSHAERGGSWSYSGSGAHVHDPPVGSVEGWAFNGNGGSTQPTVPPPPPPRTEPEPSPEAEPSPQPDTSPGDPAPAPAGEPAGEPSTEPTPDPVTGTETGTAAPGDDPTSASPPAAAASTPAPVPTSASPAAATPTGSPDPSPRSAAVPGDAGTPWATVVTAAVVVLLLGAGGVLRHRRGDPT